MEFYESLNQIDWNSALDINSNDPNVALNRLHNNIVYLLDEFAPYKKISAKKLNLKIKHWIKNELLNKIKKRDKLLNKYHKSKMPNLKNFYYDSYKLLRNIITRKKRC